MKYLFATKPYNYEFSSMQISKAMIFWAENHEKIADSFAISQLSVITLSDSKRFIESLRNLPLKNFEVDNTKNERRIFGH